MTDTESFDDEIEPSLIPQVDFVVTDDIADLWLHKAWERVTEACDSLRIDARVNPQDARDVLVHICLRAVRPHGRVYFPSDWEITGYIPKIWEENPSYAVIER